MSDSIFQTATSFLLARKKNLLVLLFMLIFLLGFKYGDPGAYSISRYRVAADVAIFLATPLAILWEWREFVKIYKNNKGKELYQRTN